jgi:predicted metal-dependent enzyme (double-stranded beta helix superfamily)
LFDVDTFVADCKVRLAETQPLLAIKEILERAVAEPDSVAAALRAKPGVEVLHRSPELTVLSVLVPGGLPSTPAHDHRMWALVGVYAGQEDNKFFRRADTGLAGSGGRSLRVSDTLAMGDDTIHAIRNPLDHGALAAIHVYGGDLIGAERSMWREPDYNEEPYDDAKVVGRDGFRASRP